MGGLPRPAHDDAIVFGDRRGVSARALGISQDPLEKRFRRAVGASPKHLASLIRLSTAIADRRAGGPAAWSRRVIAAGFYDQSHFIREFRAVVGEAPEKFFRAGNYC